MKKLFRAPIRTFIAGLFTVLPLALTVVVIIWVASLVDQFVGPHSAAGKVLISIGLTVVETKIAAYLIGIVIVLATVYVLGLFVEAGLQRRLQTFIDKGLRRIPLVGSVYDLAHQRGRFARPTLVPARLIHLLLVGLSAASLEMNGRTQNLMLKPFYEAHPHNPQNGIPLP